jgi:hypothetical protein
VTETRHNIEQLIERSSADGAGAVPMHVRRSAFASVADHPNFACALSHPVCHAVIMVEPKSFFDRSRWPDATKAAIIEWLHDADSVVLLSFMTLISFARNIYGGGITYDFVIQSKTYGPHTALGSW